ncbi:MAG: SPOR domain-containing protein [Flavobacteriales bacterium]|nr:SPOR domain-containing protein [Flavobacteriales bacterium]
MEHNDNEQRLRILQERLGQIKSKQESQQTQQPRVENTPAYPTYNPKATQSSDEDVILVNEDIKEKKPSGFSSKVFVRLLILVILIGGGYYLYTNFDLSAFIPKNNEVSEQITSEEAAPLQYSLDFGEAKHLVILSSFEDENAAIELMNKKTNEGYAANYFFLPSVSNSNEQIYRVYLGPYFSEAEAKQWAGTLESKSEILNL